MVKEKQQAQAARGKKGKKKGDSTSHTPASSNDVSIVLHPYA